MADDTTNYDKIPQELRTSNLWCNVKLDPRPNKKPRKLPIRSGRGSQPIDITDVSNGRPFDLALKYADRYDGIGRIFSAEESFVGIDLDNTDESHPLIVKAKELGAYVEQSISGTGWHIICQGEVPEQFVGNGIEVYGALRYFVFTGRNASGRPIQAQGLITEAMSLSQEVDLADALLTAGYDHARVTEAINTYPDISDEESFKMFTRAVASTIVFAPEQHRKEIKTLWDTRCKQDDNYDQEENDKTLNRFVNDTINDQNKTPPEYLLKHLPSRTTLLKPEPEQSEMFVSFNHLRNLKPKYDWGIKGIYQRDTINLLFGPWGSYKSFALLDMLIHVAAGCEWHGREVKQGPVFLIIGEGNNGISRRIQAWCKHHNLPEDTDIPLYVSTIPADLSSTEAMAKMAQVMDKLSKVQPELIAIDTLHNSMGGGDENSAKDIGIVLKNVNAVRRTFHSSVWLVHHTGQSNQERSRGSYSIEAGMDTIVRMEVNTEQSASFVCHKMKDAEPFSPVDLFMQQVTIGEDEDKAAITSLVPVDSPSAPSAILGEELGFTGKKLEAFEVLFEMGGIGENVPLDEFRKAVALKFEEDGYGEESARKNAERAVRGICENKRIFKRGNVIKIADKG